jgi:hypothetical protein
MDNNLYIFRWEDHRGTVILADGHIKAENGLLTITSAREEDSGNYTCVVSNTAGEQRKNVWIVVSGKHVCVVWSLYGHMYGSISKVHTALRQITIFTAEHKTVTVHINDVPHAHNKVFDIEPLSNVNNEQWFSIR